MFILVLVHFIQCNFFAKDLKYLFILGCFDCKDTSITVDELVLYVLCPGNRESDLRLRGNFHLGSCPFYSMQLFCQAKDPKYLFIPGCLDTSITVDELVFHYATGKYRQP